VASLAKLKRAAASTAPTQNSATFTQFAARPERPTAFAQLAKAAHGSPALS